MHVFRWQVVGGRVRFAMPSYMVNINVEFTYTSDCECCPGFVTVRHMCVISKISWIFIRVNTSAEIFWNIARQSTSLIESAFETFGKVVASEMCWKYNVKISSTLLITKHFNCKWSSLTLQWKANWQCRVKCLFRKKFINYILIYIPTVSFVTFKHQRLSNAT